MFGRGPLVMGLREALPGSRVESRPFGFCMTNDHVWQLFASRVGKG